MADLEKRALYLARTLGDSIKAGRLDETLDSLTQAAVAILPGVDDASITVRHRDGTLESYALTSSYLQRLDDSQYEEQEGPCYDGVFNNAVTICGDVAHDPRYPR